MNPDAPYSISIKQQLECLTKSLAPGSHPRHANVALLLRWQHIPLWYANAPIERVQILYLPLQSRPAVWRKNPWNASLLVGFHSEASGVSRWCWGRLGKQGRMRSQPPGPPPEWRNQLKGLSLLSRLFSAEIPPADIQPHQHFFLLLTSWAPAEWGVSAPYLITADLSAPNYAQSLCGSCYCHSQTQRRICLFKHLVCFSALTKKINKIFFFKKGLE